MNCEVEKKQSKQQEQQRYGDCLQPYSHRLGPRCCFTSHPLNQHLPFLIPLIFKQPTQERSVFSFLDCKYPAAWGQNKSHTSQHALCCKGSCERQTQSSLRLETPMVKLFLIRQYYLALYLFCKVKLIFLTWDLELDSQHVSTYYIYNIIYSCSKTMNYLGKHLSGHGQVLYAGNHKMLMKKINQRMPKYLEKQTHEASAQERSYFSPD